MTHWRKKIIWIASVVVVLGLFVLISGWYVGGTLLAPANRKIGAPPQELPLVASTISSNSGSEVAAWYAAADGVQATIILLHPIRADRRAMLGRAKLFFEAGYSVLMIDMQAHGESPGEHITVGYRESYDVCAAVDYVRSLNPNHKIGIVGWSLGGAATLLAMPLEIDALVLESVYPTISEAVHNRIAIRLGPLSYVLSPVLLMQLQPRLGIAVSELRPIDKLAEIDCPVLIASGDLDEHTTLAETERMFEAAKEPKQLAIFKGVDHSDLLAKSSTQYQSEVLTFIEEYLGQEQ